MKKKRAIIIGAGIGGLGTAIYLAKAGFQVTIYERNKKSGGRCQLITKHGHVFDTGPTMYLFPDIYANFFHSIGEDSQKYFKLLKSDPIYKLNFDGDTSITLTPNMEKMRRQLETIEPGSYSSFQKLISESKNFYDFANERLIYNSLEKPWDYFNLKNLYLMLKYKALLPHNRYISSFFKHPALKIAFTFQDSYLSLNPFTSPALYSMFSYSELVEGNFLPEGGMYQVIQALLKIAEKNNVKIFYESPVEKINLDTDHAQSITLQNGKIREADCIVVNADLSYAYNKLLSEKYSNNTIWKKKYSCSAISFHWGLDKVYPQLKTHNLFFSKDYRQGFEQVINGNHPPDQPHFYVQAPARTDHSRAPTGEDTVSIVVPINNLGNVSSVNWDNYSKKLREYIIRRLVSNGLKDIKKHIKFEICYTPRDWETGFNLTHGAVYGLHHNFSQIGYLRGKRQHKKYKNVYFVGASTHPGSGLPTVLLSSKYTSRKILKDFNIQPLSN